MVSEFETNRDYEQLEKMWTGIRRSTTRNLRKDFEDYVRLVNKGAKEMGESVINLKRVKQEKKSIKFLKTI